MTAEALIEQLGLRPHPEGGAYVEVYRPPSEGRPAVSLIYYLLRRGERSHWHRVRDAVEIWHFYGGDPLRLSTWTTGRAVEHTVIGSDLAAGLEPHAVVEADVWQAAETVGDWSLCGCTVTPAFDFAAFELAPPDWSPPG